MFEAMRGKKKNTTEMFRGSWLQRIGNTDTVSASVPCDRGSIRGRMCYERARKCEACRSMKRRAEA